MIGNNILIDTNVVIELFRGNLEIRKIFDSSKIVNIPFAVLGELYFGARKSNNFKKNITLINQLLANCVVIDADNNTSLEYGFIKSSLINKGKAIPENDIWIAAISKQYKLDLLTFDKHFLNIDEINIIKLNH